MSPKNRRFWNVKLLRGKKCRSRNNTSDGGDGTPVNFYYLYMACTASGSTTSHKGILSVVKNPRAHVHSLARLHQLAELARLACSRSLFTRSFVILRAHVFFSVILQSVWVYYRAYASHEPQFKPMPPNAAYAMSFWTCSVTCTHKYIACASEMENEVNERV